MEVSNKADKRIGNVSTKPTSLALAVTLSLVAFGVAFVQTWVHTFGLHALPRLASAFNHPQAIGELIAESIGASLFFPSAHVAIASLFKSKRNSSSRRRIFIGWSLVIVLIGVLSLWMKSKGF